MALFTDVRIKVLNKEKLLALASVKVGDAVWLTGIRVQEGQRGKFIAMPVIKDKTGEYQDIFFPGSRQVREEMQTLILSKYEAALRSLPAGDSRVPA